MKKSRCREVGLLSSMKEVSPDNLVGLPRKALLNNEQLYKQKKKAAVCYRHKV
jgi:hypothetical protein